MRLRSFPSFVFVAVMFVVQVGVFVSHAFVPVFQRCGIAGRPEKKRQNSPAQCDAGKDQESGVQPECPSDPPCQRVGCQPAGVRQRELGGIQGGPVAFMG